MDHEPVSLGFIGIGAIAEAVITGLVDCGRFEGPIVISERSRARSAALAERFPNVKVETDNQAIVDQCEFVFLSVLPDQAREVLMRLNLRKEQSLVSLVAGMELNEIRQLSSPVRNVFRIIPMPPIEFGVGPIPLCPPNERISSLLGCCGEVIEIEDEKKFLAFSVASGMMAMHHGITATLAAWMTNLGLEAEKSSAYASSLFHALATIETRSTAEQLAALPDESVTVGGLNEQVLRELREHDWFEILKGRMDSLGNRLG